MPIKYITLTLLFLFGNFAPSGKSSYDNLTKLARSIPQKPNLIHGEWSLYVLDTQNDQVIIDINSLKSLTPASNLKLLTSAIALDLLGEEKIFNTSLEYSGTINEKGILMGDLYIRGE